jgi:hypothetical protein
VVVAVVLEDITEVIAVVVGSYRGGRGVVGGHCRCGSGGGEAFTEVVAVVVVDIPEVLAVVVEDITEVVAVVVSEVTEVVAVVVENITDLVAVVVEDITEVVAVLV